MTIISSAKEKLEKSAQSIDIPRTPDLTPEEGRAIFFYIQRLEMFEEERRVERYGEQVRRRLPTQEK